MHHLMHHNQNFLLKLGCVQQKADLHGFYWYNDGELSGVFSDACDDFIWDETDAFENIL